MLKMFFGLFAVLIIPGFFFLGSLATPPAYAAISDLRVFLDHVSGMDFGTNWGAAANEAHRFCQGKGYETGFPVGEEGRDNFDRRTVQIWCLR